MNEGHEVLEFHAAQRLNLASAARAQLGKGCYHRCMGGVRGHKGPLREGDETQRLRICVVNVSMASASYYYPL